MSDIRAWKKIRSLGEGGQGQTFVVQRSDGTDGQQYVLKTLKIKPGAGASKPRLLPCYALPTPTCSR